MDVQPLLRLVRSASPAPVAAPDLPIGHVLQLSGRGTTFVREVPGPAGAPVVLLLHGLGASADLNWWHTYDVLGRHFRVLAIDHRGHGRGIRGGRFRLSDCADDAVAAAAALGVDRFIAVGYSMGGPISQLIWHRHRDVVAGLVLCATSRDFRGSPREWATFGLLPWIALAARAVPWSPILGLGARAIASRMSDDDYGRWMLEEARRSDPVAVIEAAASLGRFTSRAWIGEIDVPVAVVATALDTLVPARRQVKLAMALPTATIHVVDGDHYVARPEREGFLEALEEACTLVARRARASSPGPAPAPSGRATRRAQ